MYFLADNPNEAALVHAGTGEPPREVRRRRPGSDFRRALREESKPQRRDTSLGISSDSYHQDCKSVSPLL